MVSTVHSVKKIYKVAVIPGDGIGAEITAATLRVLETLADAEETFYFQWEHLDWSSATYKQRGYYIPEDGIAKLQQFDAIFFGAVGWPGMRTAELSTTRFPPPNCFED
jgi:isocitrate/isopropylmalate dehydrogenase